MVDGFRHLEQNKGRVEVGPPWYLELNPTGKGYSNSQIDDYGSYQRKKYKWYPGTRLRLCARFSHSSGDLLGTAGFGFWNAPFGDVSIPWPALPKAAWFFFASRPTDLPLRVNGPGRGWFVSTLDATTLTAIGLAPFAPVVALLNNVKPIRKQLWPAIRRRLNLSFAPITTAMDQWHIYELVWLQTGCRFLVDGEVIMESHFSPRGPLGFVAWIDNQYLVATPNGRLGWGTLTTVAKQWLMIADLEVSSFDSQ